MPLQLDGWAAQLANKQLGTNGKQLENTKNMNKDVRLALQYQWTAADVLQILANKLHNKSGLVVPEGIALGHGKRPSGRCCCSFCCQLGMNCRESTTTIYGCEELAFLCVCSCLVYLLCCVLGM